MNDVDALLMEAGEALNRAGWLLSLTNAAEVLAKDPDVADAVAETVDMIAQASARFHEWKNPSGEVGNHK